MNYFKDGWNLVHLLGSCVLAITLYKFFPNELAFIIAWFAGLLWEGADELNKRLKWNVCFLDPDGFDWRDWFVMDLIGIFLAMYLSGVTW